MVWIGKDVIHCHGQMISRLDNMEMCCLCKWLKDAFLLSKHEAFEILVYWCFTYLIWICEVRASQCENCFVRAGYLKYRFLNVLFYLQRSFFVVHNEIFSPAVLCVVSNGNQTAVNNRSN